MTHMTKHQDEDLIHPTTKKRPRPFVLYSRVSTKDQVKGISLDAQQHLLNNYVDQAGGVIFDAFQDVASAYGPKASKRLGLLASISKCRATGAGLLVSKVDRFSRNVSILEDLDLSGVRIVSVAEGIVGKKRLRFLIEAAQNESAEAARNTSEALAKRKAAGKRLGNTKNLSEAQRLGTEAVKQRKMVKVRDLSIFIESRPDIIDMTWQARVKLLNRSGHHNCGNKLGFSPVPWVGDALRKPFKEALELLEAKRAQTVSFLVGDIIDKAQSAVAAAGGATAPTASSCTVTAVPIKIESQGALQSLSAPVYTTSAPVIDIATFQPVSFPTLTAIRPSFARRPLRSDEKIWLLSIMHNRGLSTKAVMDELSLPRRDCSLWMSVSQGTNISEDMLERLSGWFSANANHILEVA